MLTDEGDFHASGPIVMPDKSVVLILDTQRPNPLWKFAGGRKQRIKPFGKKHRGETPLECFLREGFEETGIKIKKRETEYVLTEEKGNHNKHYFISRLKRFKKPVPESKEYEKTRIFTLNELKWLDEFHPQYREVFYKHMLPIIEGN